METQLANQALTSTENKVLDTVVRELQEVKKKIANLENKTVLEALQLPEEDLKSIGIIKEDPRRIRKGRGARPLL